MSGRLSSDATRWLLVSAYACLILGLSSIPAGAMPEAPQLWRWDKVVHACEYALAAVLLFRALRGSLFTVAALTVLLCSAFAGLDELYQSTIPGRDSSALDILADITGATIATIGAALSTQARPAKLSETRETGE